MIVALATASFSAGQEPDPEPCLGATAVVWGTVTGPDGNVVPGAIVKYTGIRWDPDCRGGMQADVRVLTDSTGEYRIEVPLGRGRRLSVQHPDSWAFPSGEWLRLSEVVPGSNRADYQFKLFHVHGRVVDAEGAPILKGLVTYYPKPSKGALMCGTGLPQVRIRDGRFEMITHVPETWVLLIGSGFSVLLTAVPSTPQSVFIGSDTTITITAHAYQIQGSVRNRRGRELSRGIGAEGSTADGDIGRSGDQVDQKGRFSLLLPRGNYRLVADAGNDRTVQNWEESLLVSRSTRLDIPLDYVAWTGTVREESSRAPLDSVWVSAWDRDPKSRGRAACMTDANGAFHLLVRRGQVSDLYLEDDRFGTRAPVGKREDLEQDALAGMGIARKWVSGIASSRDTSFVVTMRRTR